LSPELSLFVGSIELKAAARSDQHLNAMPLQLLPQLVAESREVKEVNLF
jgi:hypothetical protein